MKPYLEKILNENTILRGFSSEVDHDQLVWHRDAESRVIVVVEGTGWQFQRDNELPVLLSEGDRVSVPSGEYHRLIKGDTDLFVVVIKEEKKKLSKKQMKIAQAAPPPDEITGADFKALSKKKKLDEGDTNRLVCPKCGTHNTEGIDACSNCGHPYDDEFNEIPWKEVASESKEPVYPSSYRAGEGTKRNKDLDRCTKLYKDGKTKEAAACREKMEKPHRKNESLTLSREALDILINDSVEEAKLDEVLKELESRLDEKKKKGKSPKGLSKAVKKSLDKKADKRCLTRGSVYSEFRKGLAAFLSSGSRKGMSAHQWAHARVNSAQPSKSWATVKKRKTCPKKKK